MLENVNKYGNPSRQMGLFGGTVFPLFMGFASDAMGQAGAVAVMTVGVIYLFCFWLKK